MVICENGHLLHMVCIVSKSFFRAQISTFPFHRCIGPFERMHLISQLILDGVTSHIIW